MLSLSSATAVETIKTNVEAGRIILGLRLAYWTEMAQDIEP
jgi:hypothetical protein